MSSSLLEGFAGTVEGSFFKAPKWVDVTKKPGTTSQAGVYGNWANVIRSYASSAFFFYSPNFIWFVIAALVYVVFPYDLELAKEWAVGWVVYRAIVNLLVVTSFFGFWNLSLYTWGFSKRKFSPDKMPTSPRMFHNIWYSLMGTLQWTCWEVCFLHAYATGRLGYVSNAQALSSWQEMAKFFAWVLFVPLWRDFHFYFAHRFLHMRFLYKYVHSLHHRNTDIEPFSGLCMHPVEHLYYFSCVGPSLYIHASPFVMLWNGIHLLISPAASHSGWEDHWQSDQFHYIHHAKFECNYGTSGPPLDKLFGTFREKLGASEEYKGEAKDDTSATPSTPSDETSSSSPTGSKPKQPYLSGNLKISDAVPVKVDSTFYNSLYLSVFAAFGLAVLGNERFSGHPYMVSTGLSIGPVAAGILCLILFGDKKQFIWPFHKEPIFGGLGFHVIVSTLMVLMPTYHFATTILLPAGDSVYFHIFPNSV